MGRVVVKMLGYGQKLGRVMRQDYLVFLYLRPVNAFLSAARVFLQPQNRRCWKVGRGWALHEAGQRQSRRPRALRSNRPTWRAEIARWILMRETESELDMSVVATGGIEIRTMSQHILASQWHCLYGHFSTSSRTGY